VENGDSRQNDSARWVLSPRDCHVHLLVVDSAPGVLTAWCGEVLPPVAARFSDRPHGSLACPQCAERAESGDPIVGWPLVEPPTSVAPGGQPVPSAAQQCPAEELWVPPPRFSHPGRRSGAGVPVPDPDGPSGAHHGPEVARPRWGCCPADRLLYLLDPAAVWEAVVGWAPARCGRLIVATDLTLRGESVGWCGGCLAARSTP
jgi:hypothetical protein